MIGINGYQYISNDYHCMVCDDPDSCSNCDEIRVVPWVQDAPYTFISDGITQDECENSGSTWDLGEQIFHYDYSQEQCDLYDFTWQTDLQIIHELDEQECIENNYSWFHDLCVEFDGEACVEDIYGCLYPADVWGNWDITLRDLVIVNKQGYEVARLNLTYTNPDPNSTCGENYQTIKDLIIGAR